MTTTRSAAGILARTLLMVRPARFGPNPDTAESNVFQKPLPPGVTAAQVQARALEEFDALAAQLRGEGVQVLVFEEPASATSTDSVFPNNWISTHRDGTVALWPMWVRGRREERREAVLSCLTDAGFRIRRRLDFSAHERVGAFLEGTGSLVFDHRLRVVWACRSERTTPALVHRAAERLGYTPRLFDAMQAGPDGVDRPVYHTNVVVSVGDDLAFVCGDAIRDPVVRGEVVAGVKAAPGRTVIEITEAQCRAFLGNVLQLEDQDGGRILALSRTAAEALTPAQQGQIEATSRLVVADIDTIEAFGGGSTRCMLAEVFLPMRG